MLGCIEVDVSDLKNKFPLEDKAAVRRRTKVSNKKNRVVRFDLVLEVQGRRLKFEARWPPGTKSPDEVVVRKSGYVSLAPSLVPGAV